eukprot:335813_1
MSGSAGKYISRVCVIHIKTGSCLYDRIWPGDEDIWLNCESKYDEEEYAMGIKFAVSGTKKERMMRQELISLLISFFQISRSIDNGSVFKAAFQKPAENRQSNFTVKFTPHFGTLARPKKNINTKISSMVFGQAQIEMVMASKQIAFKTRKEKKNLKRAKALASSTNASQSEEKKEDATKTTINKNPFGQFVCAVFYGTHCRPEIAKILAQKLIDEFFVNFPSELQKLLIRLDREQADTDDEDTSDEEEAEDHELYDLGIHGGDKNMQNKHQEYMMAQFKSFDQIASRLQTRHIDRRDRKVSNVRLYPKRTQIKRKHKTNNTDTSSNANASRNASNVSVNTSELQED